MPKGGKSAIRSEVLAVIDARGEALAKTAPAQIAVDTGLPDNRFSEVVKSGREDLVIWLAYARLPQRAIAERIGVSHDAVQRYLKSARYRALREEKLASMRERIDEELRGRLQDIVLGNIEALLEIRDGKQPRARIAAIRELNEMYEKYVGKGKGAPSNILERLRSRVTTVLPDGSIREKVTERTREPQVEAAGVATPESEEVIDAHIVGLPAHDPGDGGSDGDQPRVGQEDPGRGPA